MKKRFVKAISLITASAMLLSAVSGIGVWEQGRSAHAANNVVLKNPDIKKDNTGTMLSGQKVTWDCVYFGSYPQAEVLPEGSKPSDSPEETTQPTTSGGTIASATPGGTITSATPGGTIASATPGGTTSSTIPRGNIVYDSNLYNNLKNSVNWRNDELTLNTVKYRRMRRKDATYTVINGAVDGYYQWDDDVTYHYFKYEPIKWRVLSTDGQKALLLADIALDNQYYDLSYKDVTWDNCSVRSWLNGYTAEQNLADKDYEGKGFIDVAFNDDEIEAIIETDLINEQEEVSEDKVFLLSKAELSGTETAEAYGFRKSESYDEARLSYSSSYAQAMGVSFATLPLGKGERLGGCGQLLRNDGEASDYTNCTRSDGSFMTEANYYDSLSNLYQCYAIRPALCLNLSEIVQYEFAGTVCSDNTEKNAHEAAAGRETLPPVTTTGAATQAPTENPDGSTTPGASGTPSTIPTQKPSVSPSAVPGQQPSGSPSAIPSQQPSATDNPQSLQTSTPGETIIIEKTVYKGKRFKDEDTMGVYQITKTGKNGTVIYVRPLDKTQKNVTIPDEVEYKDGIYRVVSVGEHAFYKNKNIRRITLGDNITKISNRAFYKCTNLKKINFNKKLKRIGTKAFFRCNSLKKIVLPSKVEHIGVRAFYKCKNLQKAVLSKNMRELGTKAFYQCKKLTLDMSKVNQRHMKKGRKPYTGVKQVKYSKAKTRS